MRPAIFGSDDLHEKGHGIAVAPFTVGLLFTLVREEMQRTFVVVRWHEVGMGSCLRLGQQIPPVSLRSRVGMTRSGVESKE
jgi:hypothetical protein